MGYMAVDPEVQRFKGTIKDDAEGNGIAPKKVDDEGDGLDVEGHGRATKRVNAEGKGSDVEGHLFRHPAG
jgi:hypothetical protein